MGRVETKFTLLLVALDDVRRAHLGCFGITAGLTEGASLAQQIPELVEREAGLEPATSWVRYRCSTIERLLGSFASGGSLRTGRSPPLRVDARD